MSLAALVAASPRARIHAIRELPASDPLRFALRRVRPRRPREVRAALLAASRHGRRRGLALRPLPMPRRSCATHPARAPGSHDGIYPSPPALAPVADVGVARCISAAASRLGRGRDVTQASRPVCAFSTPREGPRRPRRGIPCPARRVIACRGYHTLAFSAHRGSRRAEARSARHALTPQCAPRPDRAWSPRPLASRSPARLALLWIRTSAASLAVSMRRRRIAPPHRRADARGRAPASRQGLPLDGLGVPRDPRAVDGAAPVARRAACAISWTVATQYEALYRRPRVRRRTHPSAATRSSRSSIEL